MFYCIIFKIIETLILNSNTVPFRARKVIGAFEKRAPGPSSWERGLISQTAACDRALKRWKKWLR